MAGVLVKNLTRRTDAPRAPYQAVANAVLPRWDISLAFVTSAKARALNKELRGKSYVPNVLSYAAGVKSGEVVICLSEAKKQAPAYRMSERDFVLYLFIHGILHLKGGRHGATMDASEQKLLARFATSAARAHSLHVQTHSHRHRHRHLPGEVGRRRGNRG